MQDLASAHDRPTGRELAESYYARKREERERAELDGCAFDPADRDAIEAAHGQPLNAGQENWLRCLALEGGSVVRVDPESPKALGSLDLDPTVIPVQLAASRELQHRHGAVAVDRHGRMRGVSTAEAMNGVSMAGGGPPPKRTKNLLPDGRVTYALELRNRWVTVLPRPMMRRESRPAPVRHRGGRRSASRSAGGGDPGDPDGDPEPRVCECGCGASLEHLRADARFLNDAHRARAFRSARAERDLVRDESQVDDEVVREPCKCLECKQARNGRYDVDPKVLAVWREQIDDHRYGRRAA